MKTLDTRSGLAALNLVAGRLATRSVTAGDPEMCELAMKVVKMTAQMCQEEEAANGPLPSISLESAGLHVPLQLLDTPANRRLLRALEEAHEAALAVDHERGYGEDGPAQDLENMVCETREEIFGPAGMRE